MPNLANWEEDYRRKLMSAVDAVRMINPGDRIKMNLGHPGLIQEALLKRMQRNELPGIMMRFEGSRTDPGWFRGLADGASPYDLEFEIFIGNAARIATDEHRGNYLPNLFSTSFKAWDERPGDGGDVDVVFTRVSPPNANGFVHFGARLWDNRGYARRTKVVLAEVDHSLIRPYGDCFLHVSQFSAFVESTPLHEIVAAKVQASLAALDAEKRAALEPVLAKAPTEQLALIADRLRTMDLDAVKRFFQTAGPRPEAKTVAGFLNEVIRDGDCLQFGVGEPSAVMPRLGALDGKRDLGLHAETVVPGLVTLVAQGAINGSRKTIHHRKAIAGGWPESGPEAAIVDDNPMFELHDQEYVVNIRTVSQNANMTSVNSAIAIDLTGQINSESTFGGRMINGSGGQPDLHMGAFLADNGRAITTMYSTALGGSRSRIVATHEAGDLVTIPRFFADIIITEYGVAKLLNKNHRQRAEELIAVAHPDFRADLRQAAQRLFYPDSNPMRGANGSTTKLSATEAAPAKTD